MRLMGLIIAVLLACPLRAQEPIDLPGYGWYDLPDSLFLRWKLTEDQVKRIRVIEEDYNGERATLMSESAMSGSQRDAELRALANKRRNELSHVLSKENYSDWLSLMTPR